MEKHEKIWVMDLKESPHPVQAEINGPVIVLNMEELKEVFRAGQEFQRQGPGNFSFAAYLQSKGIAL